MSKPFNKIKYTGWLGLDSQLTFSKYIGCTVSHILKVSPRYIPWLIDNTDIKFHVSVHQQVMYTLLTPNPSNFPRYMSGYDHDMLSDWSDWHIDVPF